MYKIKIDIANPITPSSLFAIAHKIEYANRKYHSGLMWVGIFIDTYIWEMEQNFFFPWIRKYLCFIQYILFYFSSS